MGRRLGRIPRPAPEMLYEPRCNIELGTWYLADLLVTFWGSGDRPGCPTGAGEVSRWLENEIWTAPRQTWSRCLANAPFREAGLKPISAIPSYTGKA